MQASKRTPTSSSGRREWKVTETDPVRAPSCVKCIDEGGAMSPHKAEFEVRDVAGILITFACERSLARVFARVATLAIALLAFACSSSSGGDAGDVDGPRFDGSAIVDLIDAHAGPVDAGELEPDAGDVDAAELEPDAGDVDAAELEPDAGDVDAAELEPDAGELAACSEDSDRHVCRAAACSSLCRVGFNLQCCAGVVGELERCSCEASL
jgi:hypothetical protein